jgi:hypothetical protein
MLLTSIADIKTFLEITNTSFDTMLTLIATMVSARVETYLNRNLEKVARTQYFDAGRRYYYLPAYPIDLTAALTITDGSAAQVINDDYFVWENEGLIEFPTPPSYTDPKQIKIIWTGGYASYDALPQEIQFATILQSAFVFRRRKDIGLNSVTMPDGSINVNAPTDLLPEVQKILRMQRRIATIR